MVEVVLDRQVMVDMVEEMGLDIQEQVEMVHHILVEVAARVVAVVVDHTMEILLVLVVLGIMVLMLEMVEILVVLVNIREDVVVAADLDTTAAVAAVEMIVVTVLAAVAAAVQGSLVVLGQIQYLRMDKMELVEVEVL